MAATTGKQYSSSVQKKARKAIEKPTYLLESVDNALKLLQMLRDVGALRLKDAADELAIAPSTAHRLFAMLVYRGFAVQDEKRLYHPGPAMGAGPAQRGWTREFNDRCRPHMEALAALTGETVNLVIRVGTQVRFLSSAESTAMLRVGDRQGQVLPAERTSGGRILLAELPDETLEQLYLLAGRPIRRGWRGAGSTPDTGKVRRVSPRTGKRAKGGFRAQRGADRGRRGGLRGRHPQPGGPGDRGDHGGGADHPVSPPCPRRSGAADQARGARDRDRRRRYRTLT